MSRREPLSTYNRGIRMLSPAIDAKVDHVRKLLAQARDMAIRERPDLAIHKFTRAILQGKPITMYGDGGTSRDYTYVDDTVQGILGAIGYTKSEFELINLGNNYTITLKELVNAIEE